MTQWRNTLAVTFLFYVGLQSLHPSAFAATITGGVLTEDFSTLEYADASGSASTGSGVWDIANNRARAHVYANGATQTTRPIDFGDGSDGALTSTTGYTFNTDAHPNGFNFQSVSITGGAVTVTGSQPLVIRSLTTLTISVPIQVNGSNGNPGLVSGAAVTGPSAVTCLANGGAGGSASVAAGLDGGDAITSNGTPEGGGNFGQGQTTVNTPSVDGQGAISGPASNDFETSTNFVCGAGGPGGGGFSNAVASIGSGGAGGAGGGVVKLVAIGAINVAATEAKGGNGGNGFTVAAGPTCSGNGSGGNGGVIWIQSLDGITTGSPPDVSGGTSGTSACYIGSGASFFSGFTRGDTAQAGARPAWATTAGSFDTDIVPPTLQSSITSKAYPLGVLNAGFSAPTLVTSGTVSVSYAGSGDGVTFDAFDSNLLNLSNKGYRFLKFRATFTNPGAAGATPTISLVSIPFTEKGLTQVDLKLTAGCASLNRIGSRNARENNDGGGSDFLGFLSLILCFAFLYVAPKLLFQTIGNPDCGKRPQ